jgi:hypothetical protein
MGDPDRLAYLVFTSGSSGEPKAVAHAHRAIWARRMMVQGWYGLTPEDRLLHAGAFNWTFTLGTGLLDPWAIGATALIPAPGVPIEALPLLMRATTPRSSPRHLGSSAACCGRGRATPATPAPWAFGGGETARTAARAMDGGDRHRAARGAWHVGMLHLPVRLSRPPRARGHAGLRAGGPAARRVWTRTAPNCPMTPSARSPSIAAIRA